MAQALIKLVYRHAIDAASSSLIDRKIFHTSYQEFLMKSQAYNMERKFSSFDEMKTNDGRANSLHYKLGIAVTHIIEELNNKIPGLTDHMGNAVPFEVPDFKLIASDINIQAAHKVAIRFTTPQLTLFDTISDYMVLAVGDHTKATEPVGTFMIRLQPDLSITEYMGIEAYI